MHFRDCLRFEDDFYAINPFLFRVVAFSNIDFKIAIRTLSVKQVQDFLISQDNPFQHWPQWVGKHISSPTIPPISGPTEPTTSDTRWNGSAHSYLQLFSGATCIGYQPSSNASRVDTWDDFNPSGRISVFHRSFFNYVEYPLSYWTTN
ncbi:hypothetical protein CEXT_626381 [Caerostris extrusa]|uniref:Uncharacterized protein n=1 Tax=Caerostris extrusa TaxID=172846 RepID=A0AAV4W6C8_CAEEX|nr:hypothetical protein CEXT_626381 [Caerostris extrusa]